MTIDEMVAALERELRFIEPEPIGASDPLNDWPVHKLAAWVYNDAGPDWLRALLKHADLRYEDLVDNAVELEKRHFPHVAAILRKVAQNAPSQVDDIIERGGEEEWWRRYGTVAVDQRKGWLVGQWLRGRVGITGQSWNELVRFYGLDESGWATLRDRDLICENGYWREIDGAERVH